MSFLRYFTTPSNILRQELLQSIIGKGLLSATELQTKLVEEHGIEISVRSINRDLKLLIEAGEVEAIGATRSRKYKRSNQAFENYFAQTYTQRKIQDSFNFKVFENLENEVLNHPELSKLSDLIKSYKAKVANYSKGLLKKEFEHISIDFSWKSSAIEGSTYSLLETEALILHGQTADGKKLEEANMILGQKEAFDYILNNKEYFQTLSSRKIREIHQIATNKLEIASGIRKNAVGITGTKYKPLDNEHQILEALDQACILINQSDEALTKALLALALISYIQAFEDGNKRTARLTANAILIANNICPLSYRTVDELEYKKSLILFYEQNNISAIQRIFVEQLEFSLQNYF